MIHAPGRTERDSKRLRHTTKDGTKFKTYKLCIPRIVPLIFSVLDWLWVAEATEGKPWIRRDYFSWTEKQCTFHETTTVRLGADERKSTKDSAESVKAETGLIDQWKLSWIFPWNSSDINFSNDMPTHLHSPQKHSCQMPRDWIKEITLALSHR